uniref:Uncharacterized protein n=1 Tax=Picea glauca TaxID=3330 RepID=A0A101LXR5_PICGL|nr:hypothetical protein ABT39_MTgene5459 [Picea glauca]
MKMDKVNVSMLYHYIYIGLVPLAYYSPYPMDFLA